MKKLSNTHLLEDLNNVDVSSLKRQRINDIQDAVDDKFYNASGDGDEADFEETQEQQVKETEPTTEVKKEDTDQQAQDVMAKTHAKKEPMMFLGVRVSYIVWSLVIVGGTIAVVKYNSSLKKITKELVK